MADIVTTFEFTIPGEPQGKARARTVRTASGASRSYTPEKTANYENWIRVCFQQACGQMIYAAQYTVNIDAAFSIPKSFGKRKTELAKIGVILPTKKPDCDNIAKVVCDALNGFAWHDDAAIVCLQIHKRYGEMPGVSVKIGYCL